MASSLSEAPLSTRNCTDRMSCRPAAEVWLNTNRTVFHQQAAANLGHHLRKRRFSQGRLYDFFFFSVLNV